MTIPAAPSPGCAAWLVLTYRLGGSHALKITVRRRLNAIGAVFPVNAVAALPASPATERAFRRLRRMIGEAGGSAQVLRAEVIGTNPKSVGANFYFGLDCVVPKPITR